MLYVCCAVVKSLTKIKCVAVGMRRVDGCSIFRTLYVLLAVFSVKWLVQEHGRRHFLYLSHFIRFCLFILLKQIIVLPVDRFSSQIYNYISATSCKSSLKAIFLAFLALTLDPLTCF